MAKTWKVAIAYERYGYLQIEADSKEDAIRMMEARLKEMSKEDLEDATSYLEGSEEVDPEGVFEVL